MNLQSGSWNQKLVNKIRKETATVVCACKENGKEKHTNKDIRIKIVKKRCMGWYKTKWIILVLEDIKNRGKRTQQIEKKRL
jgi:hypothetical protein